MTFALADTGQGFSGFGGLNQGVMDQLVQNHKAELKPVLDQVIARLKLVMLREQSDRLFKTLGEMQAELNRVHRIQVKVIHPDPKKPLGKLPVAIAVTRDPDSWQGAQDDPSHQVRGHGDRCRLHAGNPG